MYGRSSGVTGRSAAYPLVDVVHKSSSSAPSCTLHRVGHVAQGILFGRRVGAGFPSRTRGVIESNWSSDVRDLELCRLNVW